MQPAGTSWGRRAVRQFFETSSVKGVPKIVRSRSAAQRLLWVVAVLMGAVTGTYQVYRMMNIYFAYSTTISMAQVRDRIPFPDVTVCNLNVFWSQEGEDGVGPSYSFDEYVEYVLNTYNTYAETNEAEASYILSLWSAVGYLQYFANNDTSHLEKKMILNCFWEMDNWGSYTPVCWDKVSPYFSQEYGPCFTFSLEAKISTEVTSFTSLLYLNDFVEEPIEGFPISSSLTYAKGVRVVIHPHGTLPEMGRGFNIAPGHETTVRLRGQRREMLQEPYGHCTHQQTLVESAYFKGEFKGTWNHSGYYAYTSYACEHLCKQQMVINMCGCLDMETLALPEQRKKYQSCGLLHQDDIRKTVDSMRCSYVAVIEANEPGQCECAEPCRSDGYELATYQVPWPHENFQLAFYDRYIIDAAYSHRFSVYSEIRNLTTTNMSEAFRRLRATDLLRRNFLQLNIVFNDKTITELKDKPAISPEALIGNLGGILNLWIGVTFITVVELIDLFLVLSCGEPKKDREREQHSRADQQPLNTMDNHTTF